MFSSLNIKRCYRTKRDDIKNDFFIPLITNGIEYDRGTGYFSVDALVELSAGIIPFLQKGGTIRIITSVDLDLSDFEVIKKGFEVGKTIIAEYLIKEIEEAIVKDDSLLDMDIITNLIAVNRLQIKVAFIPDGGIYHEKIGFIKDCDGESIWFSGSNNETYSGLKRNAESFIVLMSWQGDREQIEEQKEYFDSLWNNREDGIHVFDFPEAAKQKLFSKYKTTNEISDAIRKYEESFLIKVKKVLYPYQQEAINQFTSNGYCHFFEMATGTGKTFTAVKAVEKMSENMDGKSLYVVVVVPQIDLQVQWEKEFKDVNIQSYLFGGNSANRDWVHKLSASIIDYHTGCNIVVSICIYDTFFSKVNAELNSKRLNKLIIIDEAHELSRNQINALSEKYKFRLGLSATPERHNKWETEKIIEYFTQGRVDTFKYSIEDAIRYGFLSRYEYYPIIVHLENDDSEFGKYKKYTLQLAQLLSDDNRDEEKIQEIQNNRSIIIKKAKNKTAKITEMTSSSRYDFTNSVIYCGQGKDLSTEESIIDNVSLALRNQGKYNVSHFTSRTIDRTSVIREFENGFYDTLLAIKCFDQGVDVPKLDKIYIMASDSLARQTIQRRGRVLRKCKESGKTIAYIYDFVCLPPEGVYEGVGVKSLVRRELKRVQEYGRLAENMIEVDDFVNKLKISYDITEDSCNEEENDNR